MKFLVAMLDEPFDIGGEDENKILLEDCPTILSLAKAAEIQLGKKISTRKGAEMLKSLFKLAEKTRRLLTPGVGLGVFSHASFAIQPRPRLRTLLDGAGPQAPGVRQPCKTSLQKLCSFSPRA